MDNKKILITSVSAGAGHVRAANSVEEYLKNNYIISNQDIINYSQSWFKKLYTEKYIDLINNYPSLWKFLYTISDRPGLKTNEKFKRWIEYKSHHKLFQHVKDFQPDAVISTHFMPPEILLRLKEKTNINFKIFVVVTDFDAHYLWVHKKVDHYFVAGELAKSKLVQHGIDPNIITVTGIPVMPAFFKNYSLEEKEQLENSYSVSKEKKKILMMAGGAGVAELDVMAEKLLSVRDDVQLITLAGKNEVLLERLQTLQKKYPTGIIPMGFTNKVHELMAISDLVLTKPGGLSTSECMSLQKPMLLVSPIPGQEEINAQLLESLNVAKLVKNIEKDFISDTQTMLLNLEQYQKNYASFKPINTYEIIQEKMKQLL